MKEKKWMLANHQDHIDSKTGILCMTTLAEDCSISLYSKEADENMFEIAHEVGKKLDLIW